MSKVKKYKISYSILWPNEPNDTGKRGVVKLRFKKPYPKWNCGNRGNPASRKKQKKGGK